MWRHPPIWRSRSACALSSDRRLPYDRTGNVNYRQNYQDEQLDFSAVPVLAGQRNHGRNQFPLRWRLRWLLIVLAHAGLFYLSYEIAYQLRFDLSIPADHRAVLWKTLPLVLVIKLAMFQFFGAFRGWWRHITFADLENLLRVSILASVAITLIDYFLMPDMQIPRSVLLLDCGATILLVGALRSSPRLFREHLMIRWSQDGRRPAFMIGALEGGDGYVGQIHKHPRIDYRVLGFLDDNRSHHGTRLAGIPFVGSTHDLVPLAQRYGVSDVLIMANSLDGPCLRRVFDQCRQADITLKMIPAVDDLLHGANRLQIRDVNINDLLRRDPVELDATAIEEMLRNRIVMVTGAGGSIGSEICRQVMRCHPRCLVLVERAENSLFDVEHELRECAVDVEIVACVADIGNEPRMRALFEQHRPDILFHAAAHKHVPLMERDPSEALSNNVLGTKTLVDLSHEYGVDRFVMISTDKAVNPTSVMGASKHIAERYVHAHSETSATKFVSVRFGNVLASAGSVVPLFLKQIRQGGPLTITHPEMTRFFMTIPEASQLVLQAAALGNGGEVFVLDMGNPVKILDLARDLLHLAGLSPDDIEIRVVGPRPGEKLFEELYFEDEQTLETRHPKIRMAYHRPYTLAEVNEAILELEGVLHGSPADIRDKLQELIPEYQSPQPATEPPRSAPSRHTPAAAVA